MRFLTVLTLIVIGVAVSAQQAKKLPYAAGFTDVQVMSVDQRGLQIMHSEGLCYLNPDDLSDADKKNLAEELQLLEIRKAEYQKLLEAQKKQQAADAKKAKVDLAAQTKVQVNEINAMLKEFKKYNVYKMLGTLEKKFGVEQNRNMGLNGRFRAVKSHLDRNYPLAKNRNALIKLIESKKKEVEKKLRTAAKKRAAEKKAKAEAAKKAKQQ